MQSGVCVCVRVGSISLKKIFEGVISVLTHRTWLFWWGSIVWMVLEFCCKFSNMIYFIWEFFINKHHIHPLKLVCVTYRMGFPGGSVVKNLPAKQETRVQSLAQEDPLEERTATHSSIVAWQVLWTEEPGRLHSPQGWKESDMTEATEHAHMYAHMYTHTHTNGVPSQLSFFT